jgi:uncharacterized protein (UPF0333 family)
MKRFLLSAALIGAGMMITGPVVAQNANKGAESNATTGLSSTNKEHSEMGASSAQDTTKTAPTMHNDATVGLSSAKKQHEEADTSKR